MAQFPDKYFNLAVVDPPYFRGPERRGYYGSKVSKIGVHRDYPVSPAWEVPGRAYFDELRRVSEHYIVWGCNYFAYEFAPGRIVWDKCNQATSFSDCELAATDLFTTVRLFRYMWSGMMQGKSIKEGHIMQGNKKLNEVRIHPTQKPVALYDWIFQNYTSPGDRVLDTHLGSGSSRIAGYSAGLEFTGFEISAEYYNRQERRFQEYTSQTDMFHLNLSEVKQHEYSYIYTAELPDSTSALIPSGAPLLGSFHIAEDAGVVNGCETGDGVVKFYSKEIPAADISTCIILFGKGGGGESDLTVATREQLGHVKIGNGIEVTEDGTISANAKVSEDQIATSDDTSEMLKEIYGE